MQPRVDVEISLSRILSQTWHIAWVWGLVIWAVSNLEGGALRCRLVSSLFPLLMPLRVTEHNVSP